MAAGHYADSTTHRTDELALQDLVDGYFSLDPALIADPYGMFAALRERGAYRQGGRVLVSRYGEARSLLSDPDTLQGFAAAGTRFRNAAEQLAQNDRERIRAIFELWERRLSGANGPQHRRLRRLAQASFTPRVVKDMEGSIQDTTNSLLDPLLQKNEIDFVEDFAFHLPLIVICDMFDVPVQDRVQLKLWADDIGHFLGADWTDVDAITSAWHSVEELNRYVTNHFAIRRGGDTSELLRSLLNAGTGSDDGFDERELVAMTIQMIIAGHETTTNLLATSAAVLWRDRRDQWERLVARPELVPRAVEELLRFESPIQCIDKLASRAGKVGEVAVSAGDTITIMPGAANRDEAEFVDADTFDFQVERRPHLTLGHGPHHCLGAALARMEADVVLRTLAIRSPLARLADGEVLYRSNSTLRGPQSLPVSLGGPVRNGR